MLTRESISRVLPARSLPPWQLRQLQLTALVRKTGCVYNLLLPFNDLIEDKHVNTNYCNIFTLYLRTSTFTEKPEQEDATDPLNKQRVLRVPKVNGCTLEVSATEPETGLVNYLPMRFEFSADDLNGWQAIGQRLLISSYCACRNQKSISFFETDRGVRTGSRLNI